MAPKYVLTYFSIQGLAEPIRLLLSYGKVEFEDVRIPIEDCPMVKNPMTFSQMPVLKIDDEIIYQATCISQYLAKQFGLAGANKLENMEIDIAVNTMHDLRLKVSNAYYEPNEGLKATKYEALADLIPFLLKKLDGFAKANNGHMALGKLTWADFFFAGIFDYLKTITFIDIGAKYRNLKAVVDKVRKLPEIKTWLEKTSKK